MVLSHKKPQMQSHVYALKSLLTEYIMHALPREVGGAGTELFKTQFLSTWLAVTGINTVVGISRVFVPMMGLLVLIGIGQPCSCLARNRGLGLLQQPSNPH